MIFGSLKAKDPETGFASLASLDPSKGGTIRQENLFTLCVCIFVKEKLL